MNMYSGKGTLSESRFELKFWRLFCLQLRIVETSLEMVFRITSKLVSEGHRRQSADEGINIDSWWPVHHLSQPLFLRLWRPPGEGWFLCHDEAPNWSISWHQRIHFFDLEKITTCRIPCIISNSLIFGVHVCLSGYCEVYDLLELARLRAFAQRLTSY